MRMRQLGVNGSQDVYVRLIRQNGDEVDIAPTFLIVAKGNRADEIEGLELTRQSGIEQLDQPARHYHHRWRQISQSVLAPEWSSR